MKLHYLMISLLMVCANNTYAVNWYNKGHKIGYKEGYSGGKSRGRKDGMQAADADWRGHARPKSKTEPTDIPDAGDFLESGDLAAHQQEDWSRGFTDGYKSGWMDGHQSAYAEGYNYTTKLLTEESRSR